MCGRSDASPVLDGWDNLPVSNSSRISRVRDLSFEDLLDHLGSGLTQSQISDAFDQIISGDVSDVQVAAFLFGLRVKGETAEDVQGIAESLLRASPNVAIPGPLLDIVGTGGDRTGAINISTPASVLASTVTRGATVVKHGNRGATTPTGSADVIEAWGVSLDLTPSQVAEVGREAGITFCFAPRFHPAMKYTAQARKALGLPTVMNILGPLINPASPGHQLVGVADPARIDLMAQVLNGRDCFALIVRGHDGLDKFTVTGPTDVTLVADGSTSRFQVEPEDVGLKRSSLDCLLGSSPQTNASRLLGVLSGSEHGPVRDAVILNAAAASILVEGSYDHFIDRLKIKMDECRTAVDDNSAIATLESWVAAARHAAASSANPP